MSDPLQTVTEKRYTIKEVAERTGLDTSYITRLNAVDTVRTYLQYNSSSGFPSLSVLFFDWLADTSRDEYVKATPKNVTLLLSQYRKENGLPEPGTSIQEPVRGTTERKERYGDSDESVLALPQENPAVALVRALETLPGAIANVLEVRGAPPQEDELLTYDEVKERYLKRWGKERLRKIIPPFERGLWLKSDIFRYFEREKIKRLRQEQQEGE